MVSFKPKGFRQLLHGVPVRAEALSTLEEADGLRSEARPFGQIFLGEAGRIAVAPEQIPECESGIGVHFSCLPPGAVYTTQRHRNTQLFGDCLCARFSCRWEPDDARSTI